MQFIIYHEELIDPLFVCGIPGRYCSFEAIVRAEALWKEMDAFGTEEAEFIPPWDEEGRIRVSESEHLHASCWVKTENGQEKILAAVYNSSPDDLPAHLECLGRTADLTAAGRRMVFVKF